MKPTSATNPKGAGRTSKYTPERVQSILDSLALGMPRVHACMLNDISEDTFARWCLAHTDFALAVKKAETSAIKERISRIRQAGIGGAVVKRVTITRQAKNGEVITNVTEEYTRPEWTADAWVLERRWHEDFGRRLDLRVAEEKIKEDTRKLAAEKGLDPDAAVAEVETILRGR